MLSFGYDVAPRQSLTGFDTLARCDVAGARSLFTAFRALSPAEASSFEAAFTMHGPIAARNVFGGGGGVS